MGRDQKWIAVDYWPTRTGVRQWVVQHLGAFGRACLHRGSLAAQPIRFKSEAAAQARADKLNREDSDNG